MGAPGVYCFVTEAGRLRTAYVHKSLELMFRLLQVSTGIMRLNGLVCELHVYGLSNEGDLLLPS